MTTTTNTIKTIAISLPADLADAVARMAERDGKTLDDFVANSLRDACKADFDAQLAKIHEGWHLRMMRLGLFSEEDIFRYLES
ncbi:MAG: hypothetical protein OXL37_07470 [Chloroflexota bacterium]|nr:hypothetical protein [Chloroflexota bacterium]MDE2959036.1 hypothetical protein [Chloroflexota bacterium]